MVEKKVSSNNSIQHRNENKEIATVQDYRNFLILFILAVTISIIGMYAQLKFPKAGIIKVTGIALIFCVVDWYFMTWAVEIRTKKDLLTPSQVTMLLIIVQWIILLILNHFYLKQKITRSDIVAFFILFAAFAISGGQLASRLLGYPLCCEKPKKTEQN